MGVPIRKSVLAFVPEATEGVLVAPSGATQYTSPQSDWEMDPGRNYLESDQLSDTIGKRKPIPGSEDPTCGGSFYLRGSGTAGVAPDYNDALKAFFGSEVVASTEYDLVSGSTTSVLNVDTGEGVNFQRGQGLLIKDPVNGWRIRPVHSVATDALTLGFSVPVAPLTGVLTGKCVTYVPANSSHQTLSIWQYIGNGGAIEAVAGCRPTGFSFSAQAGELLNGNLSFEGLSHFFNPIIISASTKYLDWTNDDGTYATSVAEGAYKNPQELAAAIQAAMNSASTGETHTVAYSNATGKYTITCTGTVLSLLWNSGTNTANSIGTKIGFLVAADDTGTAATTGYTSDNAYTLTSPYTPTLDSAEPFSTKNQEVMIGDSTDVTCFDTPIVEFDASLERAVNESLCAVSGRSGSVLVSRTATVKVKQFLTEYNSNFYRRYTEGTTTRFQFSFGEKSGGQWIPGKCGYVYIPNATVSEWKIAEENGMAVIEITLTAYVATDLLGEVYLGFL